MLGDGRWLVEPERSEARFRSATLWGLAKVEGAIPVTGGSLEVQAGTVRGRVTLDAGGVDTGLGMRDRHLRSQPFLHTEEHPEIVFAPRTVGEDRAEGVLSVRGHDQPVVLALTADGEAQLAWEADVDRHGLGVSWNLLGVVPARVHLSGVVGLRRE